jgi:hypothetical protein
MVAQPTAMAEVSDVRISLDEQFIDVLLPALREAIPLLVDAQEQVTPHAGKSQAQHEGGNHIDTSIQAGYSMDGMVNEEELKTMALNYIAPETAILEEHLSAASIRLVPDQNISQGAVLEAFDQEERANQIHWLDCRFRNEAQQTTIEDALLFSANLTDPQAEIISLIIRNFAEAGEDDFIKLFKSVRYQGYDLLMEDFIAQKKEQLIERFERFNNSEQKQLEDFKEIFSTLDLPEMETLDKYFCHDPKLPPLKGKIAILLKMAMKMTVRLRDYLIDYSELALRELTLADEQEARVKASLLSMPQGLRGAYYDQVHHLNREGLI